MILNIDYSGPHWQPHAWDMGRPLLNTAMSCWSSPTSWRLSWAQISKWTPKSWSSCLWRRGTFSRCNMETLSAKCRKSRRSWIFSSKSALPRRRERFRNTRTAHEILYIINFSLRFAEEGKFSLWFFPDLDMWQILLACPLCSSYPSQPASPTLP